MNSLNELSTPALLQTLQLMLNPTKFLENCAGKYGDTFTLRVLGLNSPPIVFFSHPQAIQDCLTLPEKELDFHRATHVFRPLFGDNSLVFKDGRSHHQQRQLLLPQMHGTGLKNYGQVICQITQSIIKDWQVGTKIFMQQIMPEITLEIILQVVFGIKQHNSRYQQLKYLLSSLLNDVTKPLYSSLFFFPSLQQDLGAWSPWGNFQRRKQQIDQLIYAEIDERRLSVNVKNTDILNLLMSACDNQGQEMTNAELRDQLISLLLLGYETTAATLSWAFYLIHSHPKVKSQLMQELFTLNSTNDPEEITQLPYLTAVCQETLRIYPIALICTPRMVKNQVEVAKNKFTSGTVLVPCIYLAHHRIDTYSEPEKFQPERFLQQRFSAYEYLPFGGGYRGCIGGAFAMYEMKLIVGTILSNIRLALVNQRPVSPVRRGITIVPAGGVEMIVTK
ncbi:cytochrome P450 [Fortiea contorta]|uniref:cytochrome P450 n=1 Tax=Fortiea contorta TaxID=1892405 RepID=UPI0003450983|nr:cytochrome P450 [Fortiea contorta]